MAEHIYLSHFYNNSTPGYGGKKDFEMTQDRSMLKGDKCNQLQFRMSNHVGTHIDLPLHFNKDGKCLNDYSPADWFFSNCVVVEAALEPGELLSVKHLPSDLNPNVDFLVVKSFFQKYRGQDTYWNNNPGLNHKLAAHLRQNYKNLRVIGFDFISATSFLNKEEGRKAHVAFLGPQDPPLLIVEDMDLEKVSKNKKLSWVHVSPLLIDQADGVPVTITARVD